TLSLPRGTTNFSPSLRSRDQRHLPLLARPIAIPTTKIVVPMAVPTPGLWSATAIAAPNPTPSTAARPRIRRNSLDLFAGVRSSMKTPSFLLNFPLLKQELTLSYHFRSLFAIGFSATASTFAFFNRLSSYMVHHIFSVASH